jgi:hypothetical protein
MYPSPMRAASSVASGPKPDTYTSGARSGRV